MSSKRVSNSHLKNQRNSVTSLSSTNSSESRKSRTLPPFGHNIGTNNYKRTAPIFTGEEYDCNGDDESSNQEKVKTMFMSMWNNVKYGFATKLKTNFSYDSPIWLLGRCYHKRLTDGSLEGSERDDRQSKATAMERFKHDFHSRIWFTYRKEFPRLFNCNLTSDCGWGCMLRTGQMMLAQTFLTHYLGRHWRWNGPQSDKADMIHRMIIKWFGDEPNIGCSPFSVHQLVSLGEHLGKRAGDWYGPASVAHLIRSALTNASVNNPILANICCYVAHDCTVYIQDIIDLCTQSPVINQNNSIKPGNERNCKMYNRTYPNLSFDKIDNDNDDVEIGAAADENLSFESDVSSFIITPTSLPSSSLSYGKAPSTFNLTDVNYMCTSSSGPRSLPFTLASASSENESSRGKWRSVIIIVPVRLGGERFNPIYIPCVKQLLSHTSCLGIIGGKPKHSLYFIGYQEDKLIYIDPHYCQQAIDVQQTNFPLESFHCNYPRKMQFSNMDPSCALGFYLQTRNDFFEFVTHIQELLIPPNQGADYPLFVFNNGTALNDSQSSNNSEPKNEERLLRIKHRYINSQTGRVEREVHTDEFVML